MLRLFPGLRGKAAGRSTGADRFVAHLSPEAKAIFTSYYSALAGSNSFMAGRAMPRRWGVDRAIEHAYERVVWVFKSVEVISGNQSRLPFTVIDGEDEVDDHPLVRLLNGQANPLETGPQLRKRLSAQILLSRSGAFVEVTSTRRGTLVRLDLLPPGRTEIIPGTGADPISHFVVTDINGFRRSVDLERVRWFREPHPTDPYSGITPLEASGLSVELDFFARLYNAQFMANDGRPGGILAVRGSSGTEVMSDKEMDRIEDRFGKGPVEAGKLSVLSGDITFIDPAAKPRDVHYPQLAQNVKVEILTAFGLDESIIGDTSGRTFNNADRAWENFWLVDPMPAHLNVITTGFLQDIGEDGLKCGWNTEDVEPLRRAKAARREEARNEVAAGLRSIKSYAELAGYGDEIEDSPHAYALWVPQGKTPIPTRTEDAAALGFAPDGTAAVAPGGEASGPAKDVAAVDPARQAAAIDTGQAPAAIEGGPAARAVGAAVAAPPAAPKGRSGAQLVAAAGSASGAKEAVRVTVEEIRDLEVKAAVAAPPRPPVRLKVRPVEHEAVERDVAAVERTLEEALTLLTGRFVERTCSRLNSPKARKGTRHFAAEFKEDTRVGPNTLDADRVVDENTWADDSETMAGPYVEAAAVAAGAALAAKLRQDDDPDSIRQIVAAAVRAVLDTIKVSARMLARRVSALIRRSDQDGRTIAEIVAAVREWGRTGAVAWAHRMATTGAVAAVEGAHEAFLGELVRRGAVKASDLMLTWRTRRDDRVRESHRHADGQRVPYGSPFAVGSALLRFPGDPLGPPSEVIGCRCYLSISVGRMRDLLRVGA